ncbi:insulin gene enhancer protein ISL-2-like [Halichondria panicea]|uniref:insulin gene enhancer protein ISL-2-like n=1 Tax=Halichondria panicea TaxID=6063 RepID=UPI00312BAB98
MENSDFTMDQHSGSGSSSPTLNSSSPSSDVSEFKTCFGCQQPIIDEIRLRVAPDLEWHAACLVCAECQLLLDENCTCFIKNEKTYCKKDYVKLFGVSCSACRQPINKTDYIMRARDQVYHSKCFSCFKCDVTLPPGEQFGFHEGRLYCKTDYNTAQQDKLTSSDHSSIENGDNNQRRIQPTGSRTTKRSNSEKGPRVRTVLSEQQLQTLRTVYGTNPRPDALLKEHLVEITGLSPRVIRVWFQNKRCKDKKKMIHAQEQARQQAIHGGPTNIPPLTPQTPLTPDSISPHHSMSAFTYPPSNYEPISTQPSVSPIATYHQHNPAYNSPTETLAHFDINVDYSSQNLTQVEHHQTYVHASAGNSTQVTPYF